MATAPTATGSDSSGGGGHVFKIKGAVDSSFTQAIQAAEQGSVKAATAAKSWKESLSNLAGTLKSGALAIGAIVLEQKNHYEMVNAVTKATKEQVTACNQYTTQAIDPLKKELQELVTVQKQYLQTLQQTGSAQATAGAGSTSLTSNLSNLSTSLDSSSDKLNSLKFAAQSAFYGNYTGAVSELIGSLGGYAAAAGTVTAAIALTNAALDQYEQHQKRVSVALDEESKKLQAATNSWKVYSNALNVKPGQITTKFFDLKQLSSDSEAIRSQISGKSALEVQGALSYDQINSLGSNLAAVQAQKNQSVAALGQLRILQRQALNGGGRASIRLDQLEAAQAISADKAEQLKNSGVTSAGIDDISRAVKEQQVFIQQTSRSLTLLTEAKKKTDEWASSMSALGKAKDRIADVNEVLKGSGNRSSLVQARDFTSSKVGEVEALYRQLTKGGRTDDASLQDKFVNGSAEERQLARALIERRRDLYRSNQEIKNFDSAREREAIESGQKQVQKLQEGLEFRRASGQSSFSDTASTIESQLAAVNSKDFRTRTSLLNTKQQEHGKYLEADFKEYVGTYQDAYKELSSKGTASVGELTKANQNLISAARAWKKENEGVLEQFPQMKEKLESVLSSTRVESSKITTKTQEEALGKLRQANQQRDDAALNVRDRLKANQDAVDAVNDQAKKGLISQKQAAEELLNLEKGRAGINRTIAQAMDDQKKSINVLKGTLASNKAQLLASGGGSPTELQEAQKEVLKSKLDGIDQEYQAALKAGKDQTLAAEEASLKKKNLYLQETAAFKAAEDAKTAALKAATADRFGGENSPFSGLNEGVTGSSLKFSGFGSFGKGFGSFGGSQSLYTDYSKGKVPDHLQDTFARKQSFELGGGGTTINVNLALEAVPPNVKALGAQIGAELGADLDRRNLVYGDGSPAMVGK